MYHRVTDPVCDPWGLAVSVDHFDQQLRFLRQNRIPLPLQEFVEQLRVGRLSERAVAITFDDGYIDNLISAKPSLERHGVPATAFLVTGEIGKSREFWWDELVRLILLSEYKVDGAISIGHEWMPFTLVSRPAITENCRSWRAWEPPSTDREDLYLSIWMRLRRLKPIEREDAMQQLRMIFKPDPPHPSNFPMKVDEVRALAHGGTVSIGAHTVTHPLLSTLSPKDCMQEIRQSKDDCEALMGVAVEGFAYPYGDYDSAIQKLVSEAGFRWACSTRSDRISSSGFKPFELPRMHVLDWDEKEFSSRLNS